MKTGKRVLALVLLTAIVAVMVGTVSAAWTKSVYGYGVEVSIETENVAWWKLFSSPQITVKNTGSRSATIIVEDESGRLVKQITNLKAGRERTISLKKNREYTVYWSTLGYKGGKVELDITAKKYIADMW